MKLQVYPDSEMMMIDLANVIAGELNASLMSQGEASLAVPGGTTPGPIFDALCAADLDWSRVTVMLTDERWVPESSERSNARLVRARLLQSRAAAARFLPFYRGGAAPEDDLAAVAEEVAALLPLSVLLLGMGTDMHVASLFPGAEGLEAALAEDAPPVLPIRAAAAGEPRVTLTAPVLDGAMSKHVVILGQNKRAALEEAEHLRKDVAPVRAVWSDVTVHWAE